MKIITDNNNERNIYLKIVGMKVVKHNA